MLIRKSVTVVLLLFVAGSVGFLVLSEARDSSLHEGLLQENSAAASDKPEAAESETRVTAAADGKVDSAVVAYYFHGTMRCPTCLKIERLARESIEEAFAREMDAGRVEWRAVDYDEPANEHFVSDYGLTASALVLVGPDRTPDSWQKLDRTWELVDDEAAFRAYVVQAVTGVLRDRS